MAYVQADYVQLTQENRQTQRLGIVNGIRL